MRKVELVIYAAADIDHQYGSRKYVFKTKYTNSEWLSLTYEQRQAIIKRYERKAAQLLTIICKSEVIFAKG